MSKPFDSPMDRTEAASILNAFESGYIETADHPDVVRAAELLGKSARLNTFPSLSNPENELVLRTVN